MSKHEVTVDMPPRPLQRQDVRFVVKTDGAILGTLTISNGSLVWFPKGTTKGFRMSWSKFDDIMRDQASVRERR